MNPIGEYNSGEHIINELQGIFIILALFKELVDFASPFGYICPLVPDALLNFEISFGIRFHEPVQAFVHCTCGGLGHGLCLGCSWGITQRGAVLCSGHGLRRSQVLALLVCSAMPVQGAGAVEVLAFGLALLGLP